MPSLLEHTQHIPHEDHKNSRIGSYFQIFLPPNASPQELRQLILESCLPLWKGHEPRLFMYPERRCALLDVPDDVLEDVRYKSWLSSNNQTRLNMKLVLKDMERYRETLILDGARVAWLKAQTRVRKMLSEFIPRIVVKFETVTGAEHCKIHIHYQPGNMTEVQHVKNLLEKEAQKIIVKTLPLEITERSRFSISSDPAFRNVAYSNHVSLWTRTMKDSVKGSEWCTLASDSPTRIEQAISEFCVFGKTKNWARIPSRSIPYDPKWDASELAQLINTKVEESNNFEGDMSYSIAVSSSPVSWDSSVDSTSFSNEYFPPPKSCSQQAQAGGELLSVSHDVESFTFSKYYSLF